MSGISKTFVSQCNAKGTECSGYHAQYEERGGIDTGKARQKASEIGDLNAKSGVDFYRFGSFFAHQQHYGAKECKQVKGLKGPKCTSTKILNFKVKTRQTHGFVSVDTESSSRY